MKLTGKVIAITGGFGNLGVAVGVAAAIAGAQVALIGRGEALPANKLPAALSGAQLLGNSDISSSDSAQAAFASVVQQFGGLDILANIAGAFVWQTLADGDVANWDLLYAVNVKSAVVASKAALPHLLKRGGGRIINVGAAAAIHAAAGMGAYAAAKAAVGKLTESLAEELKDTGVTVNAVLPSIIDTPTNRSAMPKADFSRWVTPAALADVIVFLASDAARAVTGALLPVVGRV